MIEKVWLTALVAFRAATSAGMLINGVLTDFYITCLKLFQI